MDIFSAPRELTCENTEKYRETALRLIHDLDFRFEIRSKFSRDEIYAAIYNRDIGAELHRDIEVIWEAFQRYQGSYTEHLI